MGVALGDNTSGGGPDVSMLLVWRSGYCLNKMGLTGDYHAAKYLGQNKTRRYRKQNQTVWAMIVRMRMSDFDQKIAPAEASN
jgi:hypothetical protein